MTVCQGVADVSGAGIEPTRVSCQVVVADIGITIYDMQGKVVHQTDVGPQPGGHHEMKGYPWK